MQHTHARAQTRTVDLARVGVRARNVLGLSSRHNVRIYKPYFTAWP